MVWLRKVLGPKKYNNKVDPISSYLRTLYFIFMSYTMKVTGNRINLFLGV